MKLVESLSAKETLDIISKQWASVNDIKQLASVGNSKALKIKKDIQKSLSENGFTLTSKIPMDRLVEYLGINVEYLRKISE